MPTPTNDLVDLTKQPISAETHMIAGWHQWADAGSISSRLPRYLVDHTHAERIGEIRTPGFYLFQIPGTQHMLRPKVELEDGHRKTIQTRRNEFYYTGDDRKGLVIFCGTEPHMHIERYAQAFFDAAEALALRRIIAVGGLHRPVPYDKERQISCVYSLPALKDELHKYAVEFPNQEGAASIATYLAHRAEQRGIEFLALYASVPFYRFGKSSASLTGIRLQSDYQAWYDVMKRLNHMLELGLDLAELEIKSGQLGAVIRTQIAEMDRKTPHLKIREHIEKITQDFEEPVFLPLSEFWEKQLRHLLGGQSPS
jgi:proteasome assembly chaperone (PAC2) family protein